MAVLLAFLVLVRCSHCSFTLHSPGAADRAFFLSRQRKAAAAWRDHRPDHQLLAIYFIDRSDRHFTGAFCEYPAHHRSFRHWPAWFEHDHSKIKRDRRKGAQLFTATGRQQPT